MLSISLYAIFQHSLNYNSTETKIHYVQVDLICVRIICELAFTCVTFRNPIRNSNRRRIVQPWLTIAVLIVSDPCPHFRLNHTVYSACIVISNGSIRTSFCISTLLQ